MFKKQLQRGLLHMKLLKSVIVALTLALSLGSFSTTAVACEDGRTCVGNEAAIDSIVEHIGAAISGIDEENDAATIMTHIKKAKDMSKEINANDVVDRNRMRANGHLKQAKSAVKKGEDSEAKEHLEVALEKFGALKGML